ncbi:hypothetical protein F66182_6173 [Fusarium sp. NRRL 66182]|nr:hypothetical protein F66182_6173 [Fusarium sp. NRRL 66182]
MSSIKNVAVAGAAGVLGTAVFKQLSDANKFNLTVLTRLGSSSTFPPGTKVVQVDYSSLESLTAALQGQDAVVSVVTTLAIPSQDLLIDAAVAAGVKRFLPSEFGSNLAVPSVRKYPTFGAKVAIEEKLMALASQGKISYTFVFNSMFLDWCIDNGIYLDYAKSEVTFYDGGETEFSATNLSTIGDAVVGVLSHPDETKDRNVYVQDTVISMKKLLDFAKQLNPSKAWTVKNVSLDDLTAQADAKIAQGIFTEESLLPYLLKAVHGPEATCKFTKLDNELFGIKGVTEEQVKDLIRPHVQ